MVGRIACFALLAAATCVVALPAGPSVYEIEMEGIETAFQSVKTAAQEGEAAADADFTRDIERIGSAEAAAVETASEIYKKSTKVLEASIAQVKKDLEKGEETMLTAVNVAENKEAKRPNTHSVTVKGTIGGEYKTWQNKSCAWCEYVDNTTDKAFQMEVDAEVRGAKTTFAELEKDSNISLKDLEERLKKAEKTKKEDIAAAKKKSKDEETAAKKKRDERIREAKQMLQVAQDKKEKDTREADLAKSKADREARKE